ncbi:MAG: undecaprenyl-diphosphate phosphatase [Actinomycetia bacterium]|nr:undecaprenyl-diphosphate phosphatase [Actinomycetes bacterium]MCP4084324.1 undecaprenyl-diphosphate phosphatase [Actinomycetes bacterium]
MSSQRLSPPALFALVGALVLLIVAVDGPAGAVDATGGSDAIGLSAFAAIVLGLVEGLTEYLPVSSTGHLLVAQEILGLGGTEEADLALETYAICIQAGAILAVVFLYWGRIRQMIDGVLGRSDEGRTVAMAVIVAFIPTAIIGLFIQGFVRDHLFGVGPIAAAWLVGGLGILGLTRARVLERAGIEFDAITTRQALAIGGLQAISMWPGVSRSLTTIVAGVLVGLSLRAAVEFSFLLGLITLSAATAYEGLRHGSGLIDTFGVATPLLGLAVAFVSAVIAVRWMVSWLEQRSLNVFGYYRIAVGLATFAALGAGWL